MIATEVASGEWDTVVVDGPPLRAALDMLAWPETAAAALRVSGRSRARPRGPCGRCGRAGRPAVADGRRDEVTDEAAAEIAAVGRC